MISCDVAIIGAGPYGLAATSHLRSIKGLEVRTFGEPMSFWDRNMPLGMLLRSNWTATQIADPENRLSLEAFRDATGNHLSQPVPLDRFVQYGLWYQQQAVPDLDRRKILLVEQDSGSFRLTAEDGEILKARRVLIAAGISAFAWTPPEFEQIPSALASHTSQHRDLGTFQGKHVIVVGGGQSALESAALLNEGGAAVEVITRRDRIQWLQGTVSKTLHHRIGKFGARLLYAPTDVGPAGMSQLMARPDLLMRLPRKLQDKLRARAVRPAGARWLVDRLQDVPVRLGQSVLSAAPAGERIKIRLSDATERTVDHVFLGTGYKVDIAQYGFLSTPLLQSIQRQRGYPRLQTGLETSVPGLHILGAPAAWSFGPLMQFVSGTRYACKALVRNVSR